jgi:hypothetical protein
METYYESYLRQKMEWVKIRISALNEIEAKMAEMREIAILATDTNLCLPRRYELNCSIRELEKEVKELDEKSKGFCMDTK